jgi:cytochrome P450 family 3 subfamily A
LTTLDVIALLAFGVDFRSLENQGNPEAISAGTKHMEDLVKICILRSRNPSILWKRYNVQDGSEWIKETTAVLKQLIGPIIESAKNKQVEESDMKNWNVLERLLHASTKAGDVCVILKQGFDEQEIFCETLGFFFAGLETTANTLAFGIVDLASHPEVVQRIREEFLANKTEEEDMISILPKLKYLDCVVCEIQR